MRIVLQRVSNANVVVDGETIGAIDEGYLALLGVSDGDSEKDAEVLATKISKLRIFPDENGKSNLSIQDVKGEILIISQFTLSADCRKGNRPSFINAGSPDRANELYEYFKKCCIPLFKKVQCGSFGASMEVSLLNNGPFTIVLDCKDGVII